MKDQVKYFVNAEKGVVVCLIDDCQYDAINDFLQKLGNDICFNQQLIPTKKSFLPKSFRGIARCNFADGDEFNEQYGKDLAFRRAHSSYTKSKHNAIQYLANHYKRLIQQVADNSAYKDPDIEAE